MISFKSRYIQKAVSHLRCTEPEPIDTHSLVSKVGECAVRGDDILGEAVEAHTATGTG